MGTDKLSQEIFEPEDIFVFVFKVFADVCYAFYVAFDGFADEFLRPGFQRFAQI